MFVMSFCDAMEQWSKICNKYPNCFQCSISECCVFCHIRYPYDWNPKKISQLSDILEEGCKNAERN